ncbi:putative terminase small subunit [Bacillus phage vB_BceS-M2]|nr:putative terminase small subunit [Bacillus phage PBC5]
MPFEQKPNNKKSSLRRNMEEKPYMKDAFELYYAMGESRSLRQLAKQLKKSVSTISVWNSSFNWQERIEIRDTEVAKAFTKKAAETNDTVVNMKANFHKMLKVLIAQSIEEIKLGKIKVTSARELIEVMRFDLELLGEEDRRAQSQMDALTGAINQSIEQFGGLFSYDGKSRIDFKEGESNGTEED